MVILFCSEGMKLFCLENKSIKYRFSAEYLSANFKIIANSLNDKYDLLRWRGKEVFVNLLTGARAKEVRKRKKGDHAMECL